MAEYYFDVETTGTNFDKDEIITIQWQRLGYTGEPVGDLNILKSWESSEKEILEEFSPNLTCYPWDFVFVGKNMLFDFSMLDKRLSRHNLGKFDLSCLRQRVTLDIRPILIMLNNCRFKGYQNLIPKTNSTENKEIPELYRNGDFDKIVSYIEDEAKDFTKAYQVLKSEMPSLADCLRK